MHASNLYSFLKIFTPDTFKILLKEASTNVILFWGRWVIGKSDILIQNLHSLNYLCVNWANIWLGISKHHNFVTISNLAIAIFTDCIDIKNFVQKHFFLNPYSLYSIANTYTGVNISTKRLKLILHEDKTLDPRNGRYRIANFSTRSKLCNFFLNFGNVWMQNLSTTSTKFS